MEHFGATMNHHHIPELVIMTRSMYAVELTLRLCGYKCVWGGEKQHYMAFPALDLHDHQRLHKFDVHGYSRGVRAKTTVFLLWGRAKACRASRFPWASIGSRISRSFWTLYVMFTSFSEHRHIKLLGNNLHDLEIVVDDWICWTKFTALATSKCLKCFFLLVTAKGL